MPFDLACLLWGDDEPEHHTHTVTCPEDRKEDRIYNKVNHTLKCLVRRGPYSARQLGILKSLDQVVATTDDDNANKIDITLALQEHALIALPKNTAEVLAISKGGSGLALELVRRDLTELSVLVRVLYDSTVEQRSADEGLHRLYNTFSPIVELHGALARAGIDVEEREWARSLTRHIPNLRRLRSTPWHEVALFLKLIASQTEDGEGGETEGGGYTHMCHKASDNTPWKNPPTRPEIRICEELYAVGEGAPAIRRQVLGVRLGLDVADQLEEMGIFDASTMTAEDARKLTEMAEQQLLDEKSGDENEGGNDGGGDGTGEGGDGKGDPEDPTPGEAPQPLVAATERALPALAGIVSKFGPTRSKVVPKLSKSTKLISLIDKGERGIRSMSNKLNAMSSNAGGGGGGINAGLIERVGISGALSGLVTNIKQISETKELHTRDVEAGVTAIEQEKARLQATMDNVRKDLDRVSVAGDNKEAIERAQSALDRAKAAVAPVEGWQNRIASDATQALQASLQDQRLTFGAASGQTTSSYASNEEIVAKASGGSALYGMNFFSTTSDIVLKPYTPLLATPHYVDMTGPVASFEAKVWQSTSVSKAAAFHNISANAGNSIAETIATSAGGSASGGNAFVSVSGSHASKSSEGTTGAGSEDLNVDGSSKSTTTSATVIEYIKCPMKSFRIPMARMQLSEDAYKTALEVKNIRDAEEFLDAYGSHVANGRQQLGGIFFSTITMHSSESVKSSSLMAAASQTSSTLKTNSRDTSGSVSGGGFGYSARASASFGKSSSVGKTSVTSETTNGGKEDSKLDAHYHQYIRCEGPRAPTPETFAEALFNDNSSWAVTDRGSIESLVPVTRVMENMIEPLDDDHPHLIGLQSSVNYITAAWRKRARRWGDMLLDEKNESRHKEAILDLIRTAYPIAQGVVQQLIDAVYGVLEFVPSPTDEKIWVDPEHDKRRLGSADAAEMVASAVLAAGKMATGGTGAPAILSYLDAEDAGAYVMKLMDKREEDNKKKMFEEMRSAPGPDFPDAEMEGFWAKVEPSVRLGKLEVEGQPGDLDNVDGLSLWEQRWIEKNDEIIEAGKEWENSDWEVFQMENFKVGKESTFLPELQRQLEKQFFLNTTSKIGPLDQGTVVRVVLAETENDEEKTEKDQALREAVNQAALALKGEDWVIFGKIWTTQSNSEETDRIMKIIEDHLNAMKSIYHDARKYTSDMDKLSHDYAFLSDVIAYAFTFKKERSEDVARIQSDISAMEIVVDPATNEPDPFQVAAKAKLVADLEIAKKQSNFSTLAAARKVFKRGDGKALADLDRRFLNLTVTVEEEHERVEKAFFRKKKTRQDAKDKHDTYFATKSYFIDIENAPEASDPEGPGNQPKPTSGTVPP